jgi:energy-coupling factor transport system permease protein
MNRQVTPSFLERVSPLAKLVVAIVWLLGSTLTLDPLPPSLLAGVAIAATLLFGGAPPGRLARLVAVAVLPIIGVVLANVLFSRSNIDPAAIEVARLGPLRLTAEALDAGAGVGARMAAIVSAGAAFLLTTDTTRFVDALVQQARLPARFAYGANAAYQAVPNLGRDLGTLRAARRVRGLRVWHPRLLVGLLVRAIRHADQLALAMDARGFGAGPRSTYRPMPLTWRDPLVVVLGAAVLVLALWAGGTLAP